MKGILNITICPEDDRYEKVSVETSFREGYYDISINALVNESLSSLVTDEQNLAEIEERMKSNLSYQEFKELHPFSNFVLANYRKPGFFTNVDTVYINGIYEDVVSYLRNNPELLDKEIILSEVLDLNKDTCVRIKEVFKDFPNLKLQVRGNRELITMAEYEKTIDVVDSIVAKIKNYDYSPLEQLILAYDLIRDRFYVMEDEDEDYSVSRDLTPALLGDKIVCLGFANIFAIVCQQLDIKNEVFLLSRRDGDIHGHARNMVYLVDDKYNIEGLYFFDPTFDCKKDDSDKFLLSYKHFAKDYLEMDVLSRGQYIPQEFLLFDEKCFDQMMSRCEDMGRDPGKAFKIMIDYRLSFLLKFIDRETISPLSYDYNPEDIIDSAYDIKTMAQRSIGAETFLRALYTVRKNQYYEKPGKYMFDIDALTKLLFQSRFRADDSAELSLLSSFGFNHYYDEGASGQKVRKFVEKNQLDLDIERTKVARTLRTILDAKLDTEEGRKKGK